MTSGSGDGPGEAIEWTELIFIMGMGSCSSLHWASRLLLESESGPCFFTGVWRGGTETWEIGPVQGHVSVLTVPEYCLKTVC